MTASVGLLATAGVYAGLSATATGAESVTSGTLNLTLTNDTGSVGFSNFTPKMAPGDTDNVYVNLNNTGTLASAAGMTLAVTGTPGNALTNGSVAGEGLTVTATQCSVAWTVATGVCSGTTTPILANTQVSALATATAAVEHPGAGRFHRPGRARPVQPRAGRHGDVRERCRPRLDRPGPDRQPDLHLHRAPAHRHRHQPVTGDADAVPHPIQCMQGGRHGGRPAARVGPPSPAGRRHRSPGEGRGGRVGHLRKVGGDGLGHFDDVHHGTDQTSDDHQYRDRRPGTAESLSVQVSKPTSGAPRFRVFECSTPWVANRCSGGAGTQVGGTLANDTTTTITVPVALAVAGVLYLQVQPGGISATTTVTITTLVTAPSQVRAAIKTDQ